MGLFSMEPDKFMPYAQIDVVEFPEGVGGDQIIEKIFKGPVHQQLREALQYIKNSVIKEKVIKYPDRAEADRFYNYPYAAIEEALANAVYHKAYDIREPIEVRIEKDRIEIVSFPGPDRSVTIEGLKSYCVTNRRYRNRRIGEFLKELRLTEGRNTGFRKILHALERNGSPKPEFETDEERNYFITRLFLHEAFEITDDMENDTIGTNFGTVGTNSGTIEDSNELKIIKLIKEDSKITQKQIQNQTGIPIRSIKRKMMELQKRGILVRTGSNRSGEWHLSD